MEIKGEKNVHLYSNILGVSKKKRKKLEKLFALTRCLLMQKYSLHATSQYKTSEAVVKYVKRPAWEFRSKK